MTTSTDKPSNTPKKRVYVPAIGPGLKRLLYVLFAILALLVANSLYLATITFLEWQRASRIKTQFTCSCSWGTSGWGWCFWLRFWSSELFTWLLPASGKQESHSSWVCIV